MKNYIYIGIENGFHTVVETSMEKPNSRQGFSDPFKYQKWEEHLMSAPKCQVIGEVPKEWKIGEPVIEGKDFVKQYQHYTGFPPYTQWENCSEKDYPIYDPMEKRIVVKPLPIEKEAMKQKPTKCDSFNFNDKDECTFPLCDCGELTKQEQCTYPKCDCAPSNCYRENKPDSAISKVLRHPLNNTEQKEEKEIVYELDIFNEELSIRCNDYLVKDQPKQPLRIIYKQGDTETFFIPVKELTTEGEESQDLVPMDFVVWYSGMDRVKVKRAYLRWFREKYSDTELPFINP